MRMRYLVAVLGGRLRRDVVIAEVGKRDELIEKIDGRLAESGGGKDVSGKGGLGQRIGERLGQLREIPRTHGARQYCRVARRRSSTLVRALPCDEEEGLVLANRAAELRTKLIAFEDRDGSGEEGAGVETVVAHKLERAAVEFVGPRLGDRVDGGAAVAAEFCAV